MTAFQVHTFAGIVETPCGTFAACSRCQRLLDAEEWMSGCRASGVEPDAEKNA